MHCIFKPRYCSIVYKQYRTIETQGKQWIFSIFYVVGLCPLLVGYWPNLVLLAYPGPNLCPIQVLANIKERYGISPKSAKNRATGCSYKYFQKHV